MNDDFLRFKSRFVTFAVLLSYAYLHTKLSANYIDASLTDLFDHTVRLPFAQRLLAPWLAQFLSYCFLFSIDEAFFILEWLFISLSFFAMFQLLCEAFPAKKARALSWLFILLLPLISIINYRYTIQGEVPIFYPYDTVSLFFIIIGLLLCLKSRWIFFIPILFVATLNRESSILLVLLIPALHWHSLQKVRTPILLAILTYCLARLLVMSLIQGTPGQLMEWEFQATHRTHFEMNLIWLLNGQKLLLFLFCFASLPLFWLAFYDYIPFSYRPLKYVILFYFLGLLLVGNFTEARIFTEIAALYYFPVCLAVNRWLNDLPPYKTDAAGVLYFVNRYVILGVLTLVVVLHQPLNYWVIWLSNHSL